MEKLSCEELKKEGLSKEALNVYDVGDFIVHKNSNGRFDVRGAAYAENLTIDQLENLLLV